MTAQKKSTIREYKLAEILKVPPKKLSVFLEKSLGQKVKRGDLIAEKKGVLKKAVFLSPIDGILDSITEQGILKIKPSSLLPTKADFKLKLKIKKELEIKPDRKVITIKSGTKMRGEWGLGRAIEGILFCLEGDPDTLNLKGDHEGEILAISGKVTRGFWYKSESLGVGGLICGGLPEPSFAREIEKQVLLIKGQTKRISLPIVVLGKEGKISESDWQLLKANQGKKILVDGDNKEIIIPR